MRQAEEDLMVLAAQQGNERAFEFLFQRYQAPLVRFAARMAGDPELARDAVQEAWISIARRLRRLDDPRAFRAWIFRAVCWQVLDRLKTPPVPTEPLSEHFTPASDRDRIDHGSELAELIAGLPGLERQALHLFYLEGMKIHEIAEVLDVPAGTVKSRLYRGGLKRYVHLGTAMALVLTALILWSGYRFFTAPDVEGLVYWGVILVIALIAQVAVKQWIWMEMNRSSIVRETKRLELALARLEVRLEDRNTQ